MSTGLLAMIRQYAAVFEAKKMKGNETIILQLSKQRVEYLRKKTNDCLNTDEHFQSDRIIADLDCRIKKQTCSTFNTSEFQADQPNTINR